MDLHQRARIHAALGDPHRLTMVDALRLSDRTPQELAALVHLPSNAAAHHLATLEDAGLIARRASEGDHRRRYVSLRTEALVALDPHRHAVPPTVLFVCTHNSARSQFAAGFWSRETGRSATSAGSHPASRVNPLAIRSAKRFGVDLSRASPRGYVEVQHAPELIVSVCDRAFEAGLPFACEWLHWSIPDPVPVGTRVAFDAAFAEIARRVEQLAAATAASAG